MKQAKAEAWDILVDQEKDVGTPAGTKYKVQNNDFAMTCMPISGWPPSLHLFPEPLLLSCILLFCF